MVRPRHYGCAGRKEGEHGGGRNGHSLRLSWGWALAAS